MLLSVSHLSKEFNNKIILKDESFYIAPREKVALIGVNGCGKSTFLKMLAGLEPSSAQIIKSRDLKIHCLPQEPKFEKELLWEEMVYQNDKSIHPKEEFELKAILTQLGLETVNVPVSSLSGGQRRRLSLALALASDADLLLLDEPTNHLDNDMIQWLESYLIKSRQAVIMVTHDRYFLERVCTRIVELDKGVLYEHLGNYQTYLENKKIREEQLALQAAKHKNLYKKELEWVRAGVQARGTKSKSRLNRFEELRAQRFDLQEKNMNLYLPSSRLGKKTLEWKDLGFGYSDTLLFQHFSYLVKPHDRIGLVGPNGCGKTTFLKLLNQDLFPCQGSIEMGSTVKIGYFRQDYYMEDLSVRVLDYIEETAREVNVGSRTISASAMLERFLFDKSSHYKSLERLSGGERRRLYLAKVLMEGPNVLILDEPTNDLDLITLEILEDYLDDFLGIVITVSHDRYFLDRVCDYLFVWEPNRTWKQYIGGYSEMVLNRQEEREPKEKEKPSRKPKRVYALNSAEKKELSLLPEKMEELQSRIEELNSQMETTGDFETLSSLSKERDLLESQLGQAEERWLELEEKQESQNQ